MKRILNIVLVFLPFIIMAQNNRKTNNKIEKKVVDSIRDYNRELIRSFAFCKCVEYMFNDTIFNRDLSQSLLYDLSSYDPSVFKKISDSTKVFVNRVPTSEINGEKVKLVNCIHYYNSDHLRRIILNMDSLMLISIE